MNFFGEARNQLVIRRAVCYFFPMATQRTPHPKKLPANRKPQPLTLDRLEPFFQNIKDLIKSTAKATEAVLGAKIDRLAARVDALEVKVDALTARVDALEVKVNALEVKVSALDVKIDTIHDSLQRSIHALGGKIDLTQWAVTEHSKQIISLQGASANHETRLARLENAAL